MTTRTPIREEDVNVGCKVIFKGEFRPSHMIYASYTSSNILMPDIYRLVILNNKGEPQRRDGELHFASGTYTKRKIMEIFAAIIIPSVSNWKDRLQ